ncbi:MAG: LCP family protein [Bifidobacteriaceae bacterium]|jgi:LCP family protein required for cell wall assembly|nr:LCP family protein [Bifidobacteriaceae bacterium]
MGSQNSEQPHSAAPSYSPSYASSQRSAPSYRTPNATHANNGTSGGRHFSDFGRGGNGTNGGRNGRNAAAGRGNGTVAKKRNPRRVVITILASLLAIILVLLLALYLWVNSQLQHYNGLSTKEDDSSQTWLITGSDVRDGTEGTGAKGSVVGERTDSIMLLVKPKSGATALISIPRDTYVTVGGTDMKLNAVSETYGWEKLTETIEDISGLKVDHLVRIGFGGVTKVVDAVGGIQLCYNRSFTDSYAQLTWDSGCHNVSGSTALKFSRARYSDPNGDFGRTERQRLVIQAIAKKAATPSTLLNLPKAQKVTSAALAAIKVDEKANPFSLLQMALAFKSATGADGITGTVYYSNPDYYPPSGIGSTIELDSTKTTDMFTAIAAGTQKKGTVGGYVAG